MQTEWCHVHFFCFRPEIAFMGKFSPKIQNCLFKVKSGNETKANMPKLIVILICSVLHRKYPFGVNLVQKTKIVSLS